MRCPCLEFFPPSIYYNRIIKSVVIIMRMLNLVEYSRYMIRTFEAFIYTLDYSCRIAATSNQISTSSEADSSLAMFKCPCLRS